LTPSLNSAFTQVKELDSCGKTEELSSISLKNQDASLSEKSKLKKLPGPKHGEDTTEKLKLTNKLKRKERETSKLPELLLEKLLMTLKTLKHQLKTLMIEKLLLNKLKEKSKKEGKRLLISKELIKNNNKKLMLKRMLSKTLLNPNKPKKPLVVKDDKL